MASSDHESSVFSLKNTRKQVLFLWFLIILLVVYFKHLIILANGSRAIPNPKQLVATTHDFQKKAEMVREVLMIGSQPPRCDRKCRSCGHCEAVQVPIGGGGNIKHHKISSTRHYYDDDDQELKREEVALKEDYWRGDDFSNYKPMCWKCKCGDLIFNP